VHHMGTDLYCAVEDNKLFTERLQAYVQALS
jgi:hypothetical protein